MLSARKRCQLFPFIIRARHRNRRQGVISTSPDDTQDKSKLMALTNSTTVVEVKILYVLCQLFSCDSQDDNFMHGQHLL